MKITKVEWDKKNMRQELAQKIFDAETEIQRLLKITMYKAAEIENEKKNQLISQYEALLSPAEQATCQTRKVHNFLVALSKGTLLSNCRYIDCEPINVI